MGNPFVYVQLQTQDFVRARNFYESLFDWALEDTQTGDAPYAEIGVGEGTGGGIMKAPTPDTPSHWLPYISVDDVAAHTEKAGALGATIVQEPTPVRDAGWYSVLIDPTGAIFALWQPVS